MGVTAVESVSDKLQNPNSCLVNSVAHRTYFLHLFGRLNFWSLRINIQ